MVVNSSSQFVSVKQLLFDALGNLGELLAWEFVLENLHDALDLRILRVQLLLLVLQLRALKKSRLVGRYLVLEALDEGLIRAGRDLCVQFLDFIHRLGLVRVHVGLSAGSSTSANNLLSQFLCFELVG